MDNLIFRENRYALRADLSPMPMTAIATSTSDYPC